MTERTKGEWEICGLSWLVNGQSLTDTETGEVVAYARNQKDGERLAKIFNNYDELVEALENLMQIIETDGTIENLITSDEYDRVEKAKELLARVK